MDPVSVLLDTSVYRLAETTQPTVTEQSVNWGGRIHTVQVLGTQRKPPLSADQHWRQQQIDCMPAITKLVREDVLKICSYSELSCESWLGRPRLKGVIGDLFTDIPIEEVPPAIERSRLYQLPWEEYLDRENMIKFCELLLAVNYSQVEAWPLLLSRFPDFERANLKALGRFRQICRSLARKHYPDAFHVWTGEVNGLEYFLTADKKFMNALGQNTILKPSCKPICPADLLESLGVTELDPMPIPDDRIYPFF